MVDELAAGVESTQRPRTRDAEVRYDVGELRRGAKARAASRDTAEFHGDVEDGSVAGVPTRRYRARAALRSPTTVFFVHGGYGIFGGLDLQDSYCRLLSTSLRREVVAIDYPLAPEHDFAEAISAVHDVLRATSTGSAILSGDSAGGALAVAAVHHRQARDRVGGLLLTNPNLDLTLASIDARASDGPDLGLMEYAFGHWLRDRYAELRLDLDARGLPPTMIAVGTHDSLAPEARRLHRACTKAGVRSHLMEIEQAGHGLASNLTAAQRITDEAASFFG